MAGTTTTAVDISSSGAQLKVNYAPKLVNLVPENAILQQYRDPEAPGATGKDEKAQNADVAVPISWTSAESNGKYWVIPTKVKSGQGVSYLGNTGALATLADALALQIVEIQVQGNEVDIRNQIPYRAGSTAGSGGAKAFEGIAKLVMQDMKDVVYNRIEISALWGQDSIGIVLSQTISGTTLTVIFTAASFCPALWVANIGAPVQFFAVSGANWTLDQGAGTITNSCATVQTVTTSTRTVTFTMMVSGSASAWGTSTSTPAAGTYVMFGSGAANAVATAGGAAPTFNEMYGLYKQFSATTGSPFGVNIANYSLLQGSTFDAGSAPLTQTKVVNAASKVIDKGNMSDLVLLVGTATWADLSNEAMAGRMWDSSYSARRSENGSEQITYTHAGGKIRVVLHPFMKNGYAFLFTPGQAHWVGSSDVTFVNPINSEKDLFLEIPDKNGYEVRLYSDKALYHEAPSQALVISGIVPSSVT